MPFLVAFGAVIGCESDLKLGDPNFGRCGSLRKGEGNL